MRTIGILFEEHMVRYGQGMQLSYGDMPLSIGIMGDRLRTSHETSRASQHYGIEGFKGSHLIMQRGDS